MRIPSETASAERHSTPLPPSSPPFQIALQTSLLVPSPHPPQRFAPSDSVLYRYRYSPVLRSIEQQGFEGVLVAHCAVGWIKCRNSNLKGCGSLCGRAICNCIPSDVDGPPARWLSGKRKGLQDCP